MTRVAATAIAVMAALAASPRDAAPHNPTTTTVLFNREIATLLARKCLQCHGERTLAMPLLTYAQARPWAVAIRDEALARHMPPWPAERSYGRFSNDLSLTTREMDFLVSWAEGGAPEGVAPLPAHMDHSGHWMLGRPDQVVTAARGTAIEPGSGVRLERLIIDPKLRRPVWLRGFDFKAGDPRVTRAAFVSVQPSGEYVGGWTPWMSAAELPKDAAIRLPAGARIALDVLYQAAEQRVIDRPAVGLYFAPEPGRVAANIQLSADVPRSALAAARELLGVRVTMGAAGRSIELRARRPDGSVEPLLWIRNYTPDWQVPYVFASPVRLPPGAIVEALATFAAESSPADRRFTASFAALPSPAPR